MPPLNWVARTSLGLARFAIGQQFANADNRLQTVFQGGLGLEQHGGVGFAVVLAAFAMGR